MSEPRPDGYNPEPVLVPEATVITPENSTPEEQPIEAQQGEVERREDGYTITPKGELVVTKEQFLKLTEKELSGQEAADLMNAFYQARTWRAMGRLGAQAASLEPLNLQWDKYAHLFHISPSDFETRETEEGIEIRRIYINALDFDKAAVLIEADARPEFKRLAESIVENSFFMHMVSGWTGEQRSIGEAAAIIENGNFKESGGFYVGTSYAPWRAGDKGVVVYFNEHLMHLMQPPPDAPLRQSGVSTVIRLATGSKGKSYFAAERGTPDNILKLLGNAGTNLTHYNDVLGLMISGGEIPFEFQGNDLVIGPLEPETARLVSYEDSEITEDNKVRKPDVDNGYYARHLRDGYKLTHVSLPIQRLLPSIISGIIEFDDEAIIKKIAVSQEGKFHIYNKEFVEETN